MKKVNYANPIDMPRGADPAPIRLSKFQILLPPGTEVGLESGMGPSWLGGICSWSNYPVSRRVLSRKFEMKYLESAFEDALESQGYDVTNSVDIDFDYDYELARAEYFISAKLRDVDLDLCKRGGVNILNIFNTAEGAKGKIYAKIDWSIYDALRRTVVLKTSTEGYSRRDYPNMEGLELLFMDAFEMAAHNLGADKAFYNLLVNGIKPARKDQTRLLDKPPRQERRRIFSADEGVTVPPQDALYQPFTAHAQRSRKAAVTIHKYGHGSGFFITKDGHILTNAHVVGDTLFTRVVLADKEKALKAQVIRVNKARDVALLKLVDPLPKGYIP